MVLGSNFLFRLELVILVRLNGTSKSIVAVPHTELRGKWIVLESLNQQLDCVCCCFTSVLSFLFFTAECSFFLGVCVGGDDGCFPDALALSSSLDSGQAACHTGLLPHLVAQG